MSSISKSSVLPVSRPDLQIAALDCGRRTYWTVKDPLTLRYYQFRDEEQFILRQLDGSHSLEQIVALFEQRFAPRRLRPAELNSFLVLLYREGLVVPATHGQGDQMLARRAALLRTQWISRCSNLLAIQLGGINPNRWLNWIVPRLSWLFSRATAVVVATVAIAAILIVVMRFSTLVERLPRFHDFFGLGNVIWLAVTLAVVKTLHELGHAVTCKRFGGDVTQIGMMLLVFTPALYCHVNDAWMFRRRWERIAVSAAGMGVELILASLATLLWATTYPGLLNSICLNVMFVCSVGTILINANPLLRYDGYYIVSDLLGIPNLRHQASSILDRLFVRALTGIELESSPMLVARGHGWLLVYAIASFTYRLLALVGVLWLLHAALKPYGLTALVQVIGVLTILSFSIGPATRIQRFLQHPGQRTRLRPIRLATSVIILLSLLAIVVTIPWPYRVTAPLVLRPQNARRIYASNAGVLLSAVPPGTKVVAGQEVGRLRNRGLELELATLKAQVEQQRLRVAHLKLRQHDMAALADDLPAAQKALADLEQQLNQKQTELERLVLRATESGTVIPPRPKSRASDAKELPGYDGTPQMPENLGALIETGTLFCLIGDASRMEAVALADESMVQYLAPGQTARLSLNHLPGQIVSARVVAVAHLHEEDIPPQLIETHAIALTQGNDRRLKPLEAVYEVVLDFDAKDAPLLVDAWGWSHIDVAPQSIAVRVHRYLRSAFRWP